MFRTIYFWRCVKSIRLFGLVFVPKDDISERKIKELLLTIRTSPAKPIEHLFMEALHRQFTDD